jgi:hypothetical protein
MLGQPNPALTASLVSFVRKSIVAAQVDLARKNGP